MTMHAAAAPPAGPATRTRSGRQSRLASLSLAAPALGLVGLTVILPVGWLFYLSFVGASGDYSLENYERIFGSSAYYASFVDTCTVSGLTLLACLAIGIPYAFLLSAMRGRAAAVMMVALQLPLWTALLVRTYVWLVILQRNGLVNSALMALGVVDAPLALVNNTFGTVVGMTHIMLPLFVLPVYAAMKQIDPDVVRAAASLGASRLYAFIRVILPLASSGIVAGSVLVFVLSLGFFVTPAILGGGKVIMISMRIEKNISVFSNWGAASALGVLLLVAVAMIFALTYLLLGRRGPSAGARHV